MEIEEWRTNLVLKKINMGTFLVVQWLRFHLPKTGVEGLTLVREQRSHRTVVKKQRHKREGVL